MAYQEVKLLIFDRIDFFVLILTVISFCALPVPERVCLGVCMCMRERERERERDRERHSRKVSSCFVKSVLQQTQTTRSPRLEREQRTEFYERFGDFV